MESSTTIRRMLSGYKVFVPNYQRAYSWDTDRGGKQVNVFLSDLEDCLESDSTSSYYFGHFLFEKRAENEFGVVDGQQRLTTIVIFLSALFKRLEEIRDLKEEEKEIFEDMVKRNSTYRFETVDYDDRFFKDYVIEQKEKDKETETASAERIVAAFDFFRSELQEKEEKYLSRMLQIVQSASCTTHCLEDESEAIQMFIFQNNRGKDPSNLEIIKAQFMFNIHLYGGEAKDALIEEIKNRFEKIYESIELIPVNEDEVLLYTLRGYFDNLGFRRDKVLEKIKERLNKREESIGFIESFAFELSRSFKNLTVFFGDDEKNHIEIHSLVTIGRIGVVMPFILKAYKFNLPMEKKKELCSNLECLVLRHRLIGTRADIVPRLNDVYANFKDKYSFDPIIRRVERIKSVYRESSDWWAYWNNEELKHHIQGDIHHHQIAKFLLWKYENHLESKGKSGYKPSRFDDIRSPELEHIAPQTPKNEKIASGYDDYDETFKNVFLHCLGNYLLLSKSHNCSVGNKPFKDKLDTYNHLYQQREIKEMVEKNGKCEWTRELIQQRKEKIIDFVMNHF